MPYSIVPYILGATISPVLLATTIVLLAQKQKPIAKAMVYLLGGVLTASVIGSFIFFAVHQRTTSGQPSLSDSLIHIIVGLVVLGLSVRMWQKKQTPPKKVNTKVHYSRDFLLGVALMAVNFSSLIMFVPASLELQAESTTVRLTGLVVMVAAASLAMWLPISIVLISGKHGRHVLDRLHSFMLKHGQQISAVVFGLIAVYIIYRGVIGIW